MKLIQKSFMFNRSEYMKKLHAEGRYIGTSKIGEWNKSDEKRERMKSIWAKNALDKNSTGYGSEEYMRKANRQLLYNKFQGSSGYLYFLQYPASIKVGFSKAYDRRINYELPKTYSILGGVVLMLIEGPTSDLADLEYAVFEKFKLYTKLDQSGRRYTEFLDKRIQKQVDQFLRDAVKNNRNLKIIKD